MEWPLAIGQSDIAESPVHQGDASPQQQQPPHQRTEAEDREAIVKQLFGEVGTVTDDFSCAVEASRLLLHGRMYVTDVFICFYSNLFGFEKLLKIPFNNIHCITKEKTLFIPNAIAVITAKKEYVFRSFWDREEAFHILKNCHRISQGLPPVEDPRVRERELERQQQEEQREQERQQREERRRGAGGGGAAARRDSEETTEGGLAKQSSRPALLRVGSALAKHFRRGSRDSVNGATGSVAPPADDGSGSDNDEEISGTDAATASPTAAANGQQQPFWRRANGSLDMGMSELRPAWERLTQSLNVGRPVAEMEVELDVGGAGLAGRRGSGDASSGAGGGGSGRSFGTVESDGGVAVTPVAPTRGQSASSTVSEGSVAPPPLPAGDSGNGVALGVGSATAAEPSTAAAGGAAATAEAAVAAGAAAGAAAANGHLAPLPEQPGLAEGPPASIVVVAAATEAPAEGATSPRPTGEAAIAAATVLVTPERPPPGTDLHEAFRMAVRELERREAESSASCISLQQDLPCSLTDLFERFVSDNGSHNIVKFHKDQGDWDVDATSWSEAGGEVGLVRDIRFVHPFQAPIGPNQTRALKAQRCRVFGSCGLVLETSTHLEDIMMADYFQIDDRFVASPNEAGNGVSISVTVAIRFFKSTMLRRTIESKSLQDSEKWWSSFFAMAREALQLPRPDAAAAGGGGGGGTVAAMDEESMRLRRTSERLRDRRRRRSGGQPERSRDGSRGPEGKTRQQEGEGLKVQTKRRSRPQPKARLSLPWLLLAAVLLWDVWKYLRLRRELQGVMESIGTALAPALLDVDEDVMEDVKWDVSQRVMETYVRGRFLWPVSYILPHHARGKSSAAKTKKPAKAQGDAAAGKAPPGAKAKAAQNNCEAAYED